ncbi:MAG TPA: acyltransferase [Polyangiaceae bacterium]|nr:acyltransferase [Polyangiaceae bacterium]
MSVGPSSEYARSRFYELDLLRFLAALAVLIFHYAFRGFAADHLTQLPYPWLAQAAKYGHLGVNLFFLISGFVILMTASHGSKRHFLVSRFVRLYPAFWICCTLTFLVTTFAPHFKYVPTWGEYVENLTLFSGFFGIPSVDGAYWSLFVEMKFYVLIFLVLAFGQLRRIKQLLGFWLLATVAATLWPMRYVFFLLIPEYAPYFIAGATFYLVSKEGPSLYKLGLLVSCYALIIIGVVRSVPEFERYYHTSESRVAACAAVSVFYLLFWLIATRPISRKPRKTWLTLGALTYPLYLLHQNIGYVLFNVLYRRLNVHLIFWGTTALMLASAYGVQRMERVLAKPLKQYLLRLVAQLERLVHSAGIARGPRLKNL